MRRVMVAWLGVAAALAALVFELDLNRAGGDSLHAALWVFAGLLGGGYPVLFLCCRRHWWSTWQTILLGLSSGITCALPFAGGPFGFGFLLLVFALAGSGLGLLFWLVAVWRNDRLTCPKYFCLPCGTAYRVARNALRHYTGTQSK